MLQPVNKTIIVALTLALAGILAACGGGGNSAAPPENTAPAETAKTENTPTPAPTPLPATPTPTPTQEPTAVPAPAEIAADTPEPAPEAAALPDFPLPADAEEIIFEDTDLTFSSPSPVKAVVDFYREALPAAGWQENKDFSIQDDAFAFIEFDQGDEVVYLTVTNVGSSTGASIDFSEAPSLMGAAAGQPVEPAQPVDPNAPTFTIKDWPVPSDATEVNLSGETLSYKVVMKLVDLAEFYRPTFELMELGASCLDDVADYTSMSCSVSNGNVSSNFFAFESFDNQAEVEITFTNYNYPVDGAGGGGGNSGELTAIDQDGLPLPSDKSGYSDENTDFSRRLTVTSPSTPQTLSDFYQAKLPDYGWELNSVTGGADLTTLTFTGVDGILMVEIKSGSGETEVTLVNKNQAAAAKAGILPPAGQARIYLANLDTQAVTVTINGQTINVAAGAGMDSPANAPKLDVPPGNYDVVVKAGSNSVTNPVEVGADETWGLLLDAQGAAPLQMY